MNPLRVAAWTVTRTPPNTVINRAGASGADSTHVGRGRDIVNARRLGTCATKTAAGAIPAHAQK